MNKMLDAALGLHPQALKLGARRLEVLAANIANADTPGFKARDIDFRSALRAVVEENGNRSATLHATHPGHARGVEGGAPVPLYRVPNHPSLDGNTVDSQMEQAAFADAAVRYQASLDFLSGRIDGLRKALRGE